MRTDVLVVDDFVDRETCLRWSSAPVVPHPLRHDGSALQLMDRSQMLDLAARAGRALRRHFDIDRPLHCDYVAASRSLPGMSHVEHADAETLDGQPNHTSWRTVAAMLYLNTCGVDFTGGELVFTRLSYGTVPFIVSPLAGRLVGFRCDGIHAHAVPAIESGVRRALAFWFTTDERWAGALAVQA